MNKKRIVVDIDGVLADLISPWIEKYNNIYDDNLKPLDIISWDFHDMLKPECGKKVYSLLTPDLFENLPIIEGSQEALERINKEYDVYICTAARNTSVIPAKGKWLKKNFSFIKKDRIIYTVDKSICRAEYIIDDAPHNLETFKGGKLLFDAYHNQREDRFARFYSWKEIETYFSVRKECDSKFFSSTR